MSVKNVQFKPSLHACPLSQRILSATSRKVVLSIMVLVALHILVVGALISTGQKVWEAVWRTLLSSFTFMFRLGA
jgi:hypothetical protein